MKYLSILNDTVRIPLAIMNSFSYSKAGNIIETRKNTFACRGFACREIACSMTLNQFAVSLFNSVNTRKFEGLSDLVSYFIQILPDKTVQPYHVTIAGHTVCSELLFSITSVTQAMQCDRNDNVQECSISFTLSGTRVSKDSATQAITSYDENTTIPKVSITCKGKTAVCQDEISITELVVTPSTLKLSIIVSDGFRRKSSNAWIYDVSSDIAKVEVENIGEFYVKSARTDEDMIEYECDIFDKSAEQTITKTVIESDMSKALSILKLPLKIESQSINIIRVDNWTLNGNSADLLKVLQDNSGVLVGFRKDGIHLVDVPASIASSGTLSYFITDDIVSAPTTRLIIRDGKHEYVAGNASGATMIVNSQISLNTDRSRQLLRLQQMRENVISLTIPYDERISHLSAVSLNYNGGSINALVMDYSIDFLSGTMRLDLGYLSR